MPSTKQILLGLTTTGISKWHDKVEEIKELGLRELALLPTTLSVSDRQTLYRSLEATGLASIPYVELRDDFTVEEIDYLVSRFKTKAFSCHANAAGYALLDSLPKYNSMIFVENFAAEIPDKMLTPEYFTKHQVSGLCLDMASLEEARRTSKRHYKVVTAMIDKYPVKVSQLSGTKTSVLFKIFNKTYVDHSLDSLSDLTYLKQFPPHYFGPIVVIELENSFLEQIEIKKFLETVIS